MLIDRNQHINPTEDMNHSNSYLNHKYGIMGDFVISGLQKP